MTLAMSWDEWLQHDAVALAARVRHGDVTPAELAAQVAAGVAKINPAVHALVEVFDDVVADPLKDGLNPDGPLAGEPFFMKGNRPLEPKVREVEFFPMEEVLHEEVKIH